MMPGHLTPRAPKKASERTERERGVERVIRPISNRITAPGIDARSPL